MHHMNNFGFIKKKTRSSMFDIEHVIFLICAFIVTICGLYCFGNKFLYLMQVKAAISSIGYTSEFPRPPVDFEVPQFRKFDMFDLLEYVFGFQVSFSFLFLSFLFSIPIYCCILVCSVHLVL